MEIFLATTGFTSSELNSFLAWLLVAAAFVFFILVIIGAYKRWTEDNEDLTQSLFEIVVGAMIVGAILFYIGI